MCYRTEAREDLRNQVGNLRFDLNTLIEGSSKSKADKKSATQLKKDFLIKVERVSTTPPLPSCSKAVHALCFAYWRFPVVYCLFPV